MAFIVKLIATAGLVGFLKPFPGTIASALAAAGVFLCGNSPAPVYIFLATFAAGLAVSAAARSVFGKEDPGEFVIDEWCGMTLALLFIPPSGPAVLGGFLLFRFFDVVKPFGIRRVDAWRHPASIMLDDVLAGLYANLVLQALRLAARFAG